VNPPVDIKFKPKATPFFWSVMIPSYNARPEYLAETLRSVLAQDPGRAAMQIEVVDDGSPNGAPVELVRQIAGDRVSVQREPKNLGLAGIWNRCIERAEGRWIHILHQDDVVKPGFYEKARAAAESPGAPGLWYCRQAFMDAHGVQTRLSEPDAATAGCLSGALPRLARAQLIQTPAVVVRRAAYEAVGGFRPDLCFTLDWEMWCRIAREFPVWYEPEVLASYRIHGGAETSRLVLAGRDIADIRKCIAITSGYIEDARTRSEVRRHALRRSALFALQNAENLLRAGRRDAARRQLAGALKCDFSLKVVKDALKLWPAAKQEAVLSILQEIG